MLAVGFERSKSTSCSPLCKGVDKIGTICSMLPTNDIKGRDDSLRLAKTRVQLQLMKKDLKIQMPKLSICVKLSGIVANS